MKNSKQLLTLFAVVFAVLVSQTACTGSKMVAGSKNISNGRLSVQETVAINSVSGSLSGVVVDKISGEVLPAAHLMVATGSKASPCPVTGGFNVTDVPAGLYKIKFSYPGYESIDGIVEIENSKKTVVKIELVQSRLVASN